MEGMEGAVGCARLTNVILIASALILACRDYQDAEPLAVLSDPIVTHLGSAPIGI